MHVQSPDIRPLSPALVIPEQALVVKKEGLPTPVRLKWLLGHLCSRTACALLLFASRAIGIQQQRPKLLLFNSCPATTQKITVARHATTSSTECLLSRAGGALDEVNGQAENIQHHYSECPGEMGRIISAAEKLDYRQRPICQQCAPYLQSLCSLFGNPLHSLLNTILHTQVLKFLM